MHTTHKHVAHAPHKQVINNYIRMIYTQHNSIQESSSTVTFPLCCLYSRHCCRCSVPHKSQSFREREPTTEQGRESNQYKRVILTVISVRDRNRNTSE